ncbi:MAG: hypothetical protein ACOYL6_02315 [Bacteriovoracaceae bacterium]
MKWALPLLLVYSFSAIAEDNELIKKYNENYVKPQEGFVIEKPKTAAETKIDKEYVNGEYSEKMRLEACKQLREGGINKEKDVNPCDTNSVDTVGYVIDPMVDKMIPMLGKAYGALFGLSGSTISYNNYTEGATKGQYVPAKDAKPDAIKTDEKGNKFTNDKKSAENKKEEKKDICSMIPMVAEMGAEAYQNASQQNIQQQIGAKTNAESQTENMYSIARMHTARKESARIQEIGWGATSLCYAGYMISGAAMDFKLIAKASASVLFTVFYDRKAENHKDWANKITKKADKLKALLGSNNCDPIGERQCYCSMESTKMDPQYCLKKPKQGRSPKIATDHCIGANIQLDPNCDCKAAGTCADQVMAKDLGSMNLGNTYFKSALGDVNRIANSGLDYSTLDGSSFGNLALAKNALRKVNPEDIGPIKLNDAQKADARFLIDQGLSPLEAAVIASLPESAAGNNFANALRSGFSNRGNSNVAAVNNRPVESSLNFESGPSGRKRGGYDDDDNSQMGQSKSSGGGSNSAEILNFAQKAEKAAQISKNTQTPIFDIISYRYRSSAWKTFDVMANPAPATQTK